MQTFLYFLTKFILLLVYFLSLWFFFIVSKGATTLNIMTFSIMTFCIKGLHMILSIRDTQHNNALPLWRVLHFWLYKVSLCWVLLCWKSWRLSKSPAILLVQKFKSNVNFKCKFLKQLKRLSSLLNSWGGGTVVRKWS